jgi:hypothetical protein
MDSKQTHKSTDLTKEAFELYFAFKLIESKVVESSNQIIRQVTSEIGDIFKKGKYRINLNISHQNILLNISINNTMLEPIECDYDILYNEASRLIALRNVKDVLFDARRKLQETKPKSFFQRLKELF